jgi:PAP2 superfamily
MSLDLSAPFAVKTGFFAMFRYSMLAHKIYVGPVAAYGFADILMHYMRPDIGPSNLVFGTATVFIMLLPFLLPVLVVMRFYTIARYVRPESPIRELLVDVPRCLVGGLPIVFVVAVIGYIFSDVQSNILTLNPKTWDVYFAGLDKSLHFGRQPWDILQPFLGFPTATFLINLNYNLWYFSMVALLVHFGFCSTDTRTRTQFFISYIGLWVIGGSVLAIVFSSAGPCYYGRMGFSPDPYAGLMVYLREVNETMPIWALKIQDMLWNGHVQNNGVSPVSAMPSLHNASAMLFALVGFKINRFYGWLLTAHAFFIYLGSIHLGWHYAVDSYVSWVLTFIIWRAAAPIAKRWTENQAYNS